MNALIPYRIISYLLLIIAAFFSIVCLLMLLMAFANIALFFPFLVFSSVIIYIITSFIFFIKVVETRKTCKPQLIKLIKICSFVTIIFSLLFLVNGLFTLYNPTIINQFVHEFFAMQKNNPATAQISAETMIVTLKGVMYFMILFATTLLIHVYETYKLIKQYNNSITSNKQNTTLN
ncbi:MAG: hypothetical protein JSR09_09295 [Bacteroidetes bacterium]|nr:hypothetical protein [Bacteroidota bacterium]MBS1649884.1 hypothetical protein [Bacteroidota bacterium]